MGILRSYYVNCYYILIHSGEVHPISLALNAYDKLGEFPLGNSLSTND